MERPWRILPHGAQCPKRGGGVLERGSCQGCRFLGEFWGYGYLGQPVTIWCDHDGQPEALLAYTKAKLQEQQRLF